MTDIQVDDDRMCFCCGPENPIGLRLHFEKTPEGRLRTVWKPKKEHQGFKDIIHGGLIATVLDEVMIRLLYDQGIRALTAGMETKLMRPVRAGREYCFEAWLVRDRGRAVLTESEAVDVASGDTVATGKATCIRV